MNESEAIRERRALRRTRVTKWVEVPCLRCGGAGGAEAWRRTGWTCYRCGGHRTETVRRRVYKDPTDLAMDNLLTDIIDQAKDARTRAKWEAGREERERAERESDHEDALVENARRDAIAGRQYLGKVGERVEVEARVALAMKVGEYSTYGPSMLVVFRDAQGNALKTYGRGRSLWGLKPGTLVTLRGTVKALDSYEGERQTVLTRVKIQEVV